MDEKVQELLNKVKAVEKGEKLDLSSGEDLSVGVMNLIIIEEHLFFTYGKTQDPKFLEILNEIREMRKTLLKRIIKDYEGEVWCISKHLLAASMRLMEVGTKSLTKGDNADAQELFNKGYQLYSLFWGLNLKLLDTDTLKTEIQVDAQTPEIEINDEKSTVTMLNENIPPKETGKVSVFAKLGQIVQKAIDCCRE